MNKYLVRVVIAQWEEVEAESAEDALIKCKDNCMIDDNTDIPAIAEWQVEPFDCSERPIRQKVDG